MSLKVLLINPDPLIRTHVSNCFEEAGFLLIHGSDTFEGLEIINEQEPNIIILDLDFTSYLAFDFCRTLRLKNENWTPLILMSEKDEEFDLVLGLELGADDFIRKPIRPKELVARVKSILRRQSIVWPKESKNMNDNKSDQDVVINGNIKIVPSSYSVHVNDSPIDLTMTEFKLLLYLCENTGLPIRREKLLSVVADEQLPGDPRIIDVFISRIREKIEPCRRKPTYIKTVRSIGYMMMREQQVCI